MKKLILLTVLLSVMTSVAWAIPDPSAWYCTLQGYDLEIRTDEQGNQYGVCVFPDGSECSTWAYYCKCEPNGIGCWPGILSCHWPCKEMRCKEAGEPVLVSKCCEGLDEIYPSYIFDENCNTLEIIGWLFLCSDCGNGICEDWESRCNCPADCAQPRIITVDDDATGANDGSSWSDAFNDLQDAMATAQYGDEIRVAQGIYKPDQGIGISTGDRMTTFQLKNGVAIKGGYAGFGEPDPNDRDIELYKTILSGDLNGDDGPNFAKNSENSYHVVMASDTNETTVLDGLTITAGNANGEWETTNGYGGGIFNDGGKPEIKNCIINSNSATAFGGGIYNINGNLSLTDCVLTNNSSYYAGGMYDKNSNSKLNNCAFIHNWADVGGGMRTNDSNLQIFNCKFIGNNAESSGGGMYSSDDNLSLTNCMFTHNSSVRGGGGMMQWDGNSKLINCIFIRNKVTGSNWYCCGGGVYNVGNNPTFINCTFSGNSAYRGDGILNINATAEFTNCILWEEIVNSNCKSVIITYSNIKRRQWGDSNIDVNPLFVNPREGDYHLSAGSPCIDAGDNSAVPVSLLTDLDGKDRIVNGRVDMGAYERTNLGFLVSPQSITVPEGATATFTVMLATDPLGTREAIVYRESGDADIAVESGALLTFDSSNYWQPQTVTLTAAEDDDRFSSEALFWISTSGYVVASVTATEADNEPYPDTLLVDADAAGANNGSSWVDAFNDLQQALSTARTIPEIDQIWVAQGMYKPADPFSDDREATFQLKNGVTIKGGYAGFGEANPDARDIKAYETILSGDLNGDDIAGNDPCCLLNDPCRIENSFHVVTGSETDETTILDGFTITGGNANNIPILMDDFEGGGIYVDFGSPMVTNCTFSGNSAFYGGGMYIKFGHPTVTNCTFSANSAFDGGGGVFSKCYSEPVITNCRFINNYTNTTGGGINCIDNCKPKIKNCNITANIAGETGGGIACFYSSPTIINGTITGNTALVSGGGISCFPGPPPPPPPSGADVIASSSIETKLPSGNYYDSNDTGPTPTNRQFSGSVASESSGDRYSHPTLTNCIISGNSAGSHGGGMHNYVSYPTLTNCTVSGNSANSYGGGIYNEGSKATMSNCILWADTATEGGEIYLVLCSDYWPYQSFYSTINMEYCDLNGGVAGVYMGTYCTLNWVQGNIDADPCFVDVGYWDPNENPADSNDDFWVEGDYHLLEDSPCIDAGDPNYAAAPNETDLDGKPRIIGGRIDIGAYEFNHIPVADAGADQTIYACPPNLRRAWIDGIAQVTLDGSGSFDEDVQPLTYLWSWIVDSNQFTATEPNITIELPVGEYAIELVVNDGIDDSEPDQVVIRVVEALESQLLVLPRIINLRSRQKYILAWVRLPEGITKRQIDTDQPLLLYPGGVEVLHQYIFQSRRRGAQQTSILAFFDKSGLIEAVPDNGQVELQAAGKLKTGQYFYGTDTIRIIGRRRMPR